VNLHTFVEFFLSLFDKRALDLFGIMFEKLKNAFNTQKVRLKKKNY
jgi:hypothetical protein